MRGLYMKLATSGVALSAIALLAAAHTSADAQYRWDAGIARDNARAAETAAKRCPANRSTDWKLIAREYPSVLGDKRVRFGEAPTIEETRLTGDAIDIAFEPRPDAVGDYYSGTRLSLSRRDGEWRALRFGTHQVSEPISNGFHVTRALNTTEQGTRYQARCHTQAAGNEIALTKADSAFLDATLANQCLADEPRTYGDHFFEADGPRPPQSGTVAAQMRIERAEGVAFHTISGYPDAVRETGQPHFNFVVLGLTLTEIAKRTPAAQIRFDIQYTLPTDTEQLSEEQGLALCMAARPPGRGFGDGIARDFSAGDVRFFLRKAEGATN